MALRARLRSLDDAVLPRRRYDERQPVWVAFGPLLGIVLLLGVVSPLVRGTDGAGRLVVVTVALAGCVALVTAVARWDRAHRLPRR